MLANGSAASPTRCRVGIEILELDPLWPDGKSGTPAAARSAAVISSTGVGAGGGLFAVLPPQEQNAASSSIRVRPCNVK